MKTAYFEEALNNCRQSQYVRQNLILEWFTHGSEDGVLSSPKLFSSRRSMSTNLGFKLRRTGSCSISFQSRLDHIFNKHINTWDRNLFNFNWYKKLWWIRYIPWWMLKHLYIRVLYSVCWLWRCIEYPVSGSTSGHWRKRSENISGDRGISKVVVFQLYSKEA